MALLTDRAFRRYVERLVGFSDRVDDVLQTVAERLLSQRSPIRDPRSFLHAAARNAAIDEFRADARRDRREQAYEELRDSFERAPEVDVEADRFLESLDAALSELPLLTQSLFVGHYVDGYTQRELAEQHGLHLSTVEKRLSRARRHCFERTAALRS